MKKKVAKLSKTEREKVEREYHRMKQEDFDEAMAAAIRRSPDSIRLSNRLVQKLKTFAERQGKAEYQTIVKTWIEERLQQESKVTR